MFTNLRIQNFKSWADTGEMRMAPITGFFGTNSSGKTAILQFILMLKQTIESSDRNTVLHLGGDRYSYVDLGTTYDIVHNHIFPAQIKNSFTWKIIKESYGTNILENEGYNLLIRRNLIFFLDTTEVKLDFIKFSLKKDSKDWEDLMTDFTDGYGQISNYNNSSTDILKELEGFSKDIATTRRILAKPVLSIILESAERDLFAGMYYVAPLREFPKRTYLWSGEKPQDVGKFGELTVAALLAARKTDPSLETLVAKALKDLGLIHSFSLKPIAENRRDYEILVQRSPNSPEVLITDVGFGVSQILPVLVLCYYVPKGSTVILEQPEIHLHPSVQAKLADVFIDVIKTRNIQIIIESHSEHLLRRLQRRIAEEKDGFTNQDAALYFCDMTDDGTSQLVPLELDTYGNINNYPEDFFGDEMGDLVAMTEAAMHRQMNS
jgi:predicted ATPase